MGLPGLRRFGPLWQKYREVLLYLFFGGLTTIVSIGSYALLVLAGLDPLIANIISWVLAVLFAFATNRIWVFRAPTSGAGAFVKQMASFFGGRVFTLVVEEAILYVFITRLGANSILVKVAAQVMVVILNYIISKLLVFRKKRAG